MDYLTVFLIAIVSVLLAIIIPVLALFTKTYSGKSLNNPNYAPVVGTIFHQTFYFDKLHDHQTEIARKHPTFRLLAPNHSDIYTADVRNIEHVVKTKFDKYIIGPYDIDILKDLLGEGIFAINGDKWRQQRKLSSFVFATRVLRDFTCVVFRRDAAKIVRIISEFSQGHVFDIHNMMMRYTLDSMLKVGFGVDLDSLEGSSKEGIEFVKAVDDANELNLWRYLDPTWKIWRALNVGYEATLKKNIQVIREFIDGVITRKKKQLAAQQGSINESVSNPKKAESDILSRFLELNKEDPDQMTDKYLRDIILNFLLAAKDSTANTISWFIYLLCKNPLIQEKIAQEVIGVISGSENVINVDNFLGQATDEALDKMHYLHAALVETMRLYPGIPVITRSAVEDDILPDGHKVKKGDNISYIAYAM